MIGRFRLANNRPRRRQVVCVRREMKRLITRAGAIVPSSLAHHHLPPGDTVRRNRLQRRALSRLQRPFGSFRDPIDIKESQHGNHAAAAAAAAAARAKPRRFCTAAAPPVDPRSSGGTSQQHTHHTGLRSKPWRSLWNREVVRDRRTSAETKWQNAAAICT